MDPRPHWPAGFVFSFPRTPVGSTTLIELERDCGKSLGGPAGFRAGLELLAQAAKPTEARHGGWQRDWAHWQPATPSEPTHAMHGPTLRVATLS